MDQKLMLDLVRRNINKFVKEGETLDIKEEELDDSFEDKKGVFVTIKKDNDLRGCIGIPQPRKKLKNALIEASKSVTSDPRFPKLEEEELDQITVEVTVLTKPEEIEINDIEQAEEKIELGQHGLIVRQGSRSGLLLPQVPIENNMDLENFLAATCRKAGLPETFWQEDKVKIFRFEGEAFSEKEEN